MNLKRILVSAALASLIALPVQANNIGNAENGKTLSAVCAGCHGANGVSTTPMFPILAGQYAGYIVQALKEYKSGARTNPLMVGQVSTLSEDDMKDLAAYFSSQEGGISVLSKP